MLLDTAIQAISNEVIRAQSKHFPMHSWHEAHSVIREEFEEFWEEVRKGGSVPRDPEALATELVQTAAMCVRACVDGAVRLMLNWFVDLARYRQLRQYHKDYVPVALATRPWVAYGLIPVTFSLLLNWALGTLPSALERMLP